jgi:hypothetical protein
LCGHQAVETMLTDACQFFYELARPSRRRAAAATDGVTPTVAYKITIGRDDVKLTEMSAPINAGMGLNTWATFVGTNENAAAAGDVAMLANEVQPVLKALRGNGIDVVAIHHHMTGTQPTIHFLHYWGAGPADKLASGFKAALTESGKARARALDPPIVQLAVKLLF